MKRELEIEKELEDVSFFCFHVCMYVCVCSMYVCNTVLYVFE